MCGLCSAVRPRAQDAPKWRSGRPMAIAFDTRELQQESQQDELWLISYADLLTLLIGFFVLIIASVPLGRARFERIAAALSGSRPPPLEELRGKVEELVARSPELKERVRASEDAE